MIEMKLKNEITNLEKVKLIDQKQIMNSSTKENSKLEQDCSLVQKKAKEMEDNIVSLQCELEKCRQNTCPAFSENCKNKKDLKYIDHRKVFKGTESDAPDMEELLRINKDLKDRNDELEYCFQSQSERGR